MKINLLSMSDINQELQAVLALSLQQFGQQNTLSVAGCSQIAMLDNPQLQRRLMVQSLPNLQMNSMYFISYTYSKTLMINFSVVHC